MARNEYGQTWWGKQWLNALSQIDYDNRLPRGRTYANNGSVKSLEINQTQIAAKVKGSRPSPYRVEITVPKFTAVQKQQLLDAVTNDAAIISRLLNRDLDPEISNVAAANEIAVFPKKWSDFKMSCSCPDWAVPCKHLAAVVYLVSREIDKNPFLVFELHDLDLVTALDKHGVAIGAQAKVKIPGLFELSSSSQPESFEFREEAYAEIDFSIIEDLSETLPNLLTEKPLFYNESDFKALYIKSLKEIAKQAKTHFAKLAERPAARLAAQEIKEKKTVRKPAEAEETKLQLTDEISFVVDEAQQIVGVKAGSCQNLEELISALGNIETQDLFNFDSSIIALQTVYLFALNLLAKGAIVPQLICVSEKQFVVRWLPANLNSEVKTVFERVNQIVPPGLVFLRSGAKKINETAIAGSEATQILCSIILTHFVKSWNIFTTDWSYKNKREKISDLFFQSETKSFDRFGEGSMADAIAIWTSRFYVTHKNFVPVLRVSDESAEDLFAVDVLVENKQEPLAAPFPLARIFTQKQFAETKFDVLKDLTLLAEFFPALNEIVRAKGEKSLLFDAQEFARVFFEVLPVMRLCGINLILPKSLKHLIRPQAAMRVKKNSVSNEALIRLDDLLSFEWRVAIGDEMLTEAEFRKLVKGLSGIVKLKGQYVYLNEAEVQKLYENLQKTPKTSSVDLLRAALAEDFQGVAVSLTGEVRGLIKKLTNTPEIALPQNLQATLRPYQQRGFEWLYKNTQIGFGSLIADDMGLGKTLQVITALLKFKEEGRLAKKKCLVIVPTSLLSNWQKEVEKFAPTLTTQIYHGTERDFRPNAADLMLTSYGMIRSDLEKFKKVNWAVVVVDEAQNLKNPQTNQTKAVKSLKAETVIAMSGTPVENRLSEYWSLMDVVNRGYLGALKRFNEDFAKPIQMQRDHAALEKFRQTTAPFLLRRLKSDKTIISDLPEKIENDQFCALTKEQAAIYENTVRAALKTIEGTSDHFNRSGLVLQMIMALKQICNHPAQYLKKGDTAPELSGKANLFLSLLENILVNGEKSLIFTQYREMGDLLTKFIKQKFQIEPLFLHGGTVRKNRDAMVEQFQTERTARAFILSLKAGGTGLNLTAAANVIHYDLWWNPAVEAQATDRAYRIGQQKNVMVYRLLTSGTFEEKINEMIRSKKELANMAVGTGESWIGNLSNAELHDIFAFQH